jgi:hypothetical protein
LCSPYPIKTDRPLSIFIQRRQVSAHLENRRGINHGSIRGPKCVPTRSSAAPHGPCAPAPPNHAAAPRPEHPPPTSKPGAKGTAWAAVVQCCCVSAARQSSPPHPVAVAEKRMQRVHNDNDSEQNPLPARPTIASSRSTDSIRPQRSPPAASKFSSTLPHCTHRAWQGGTSIPLLLLPCCCCCCCRRRRRHRRRRRCLLLRPPPPPLPPPPLLQPLRS